MRLILTFAAALGSIPVLTWAVRRYPRYVVTGVSMLPALQDGDWVIVDRSAYSRQPPAPGDIVVAADPRGLERAIIKRVAAVTAQGVELAGDNAGWSTDSRDYGPVPLDLVTGRVCLRYWPPRRRQRPS